MLLIHTALVHEATPLIEYLRLKRNLHFKDVRVFSDQELLLLVGGVGPQKTRSSLKLFAAAAAKIKPKAKIHCALNIGVCGADTSFPIGALYRIHEVSLSGHSERILLELCPANQIPHAKLQSFAKPVCNQDIETSVELVDMEGFAFCETVSSILPEARRFILKIVSDHLCCKQLTPHQIHLLFQPHLPEIAALAADLISPPPTAN